MANVVLTGGGVATAPLLVISCVERKNNRMVNEIKAKRSDKIKEFELKKTQVACKKEEIDEKAVKERNAIKNLKRKISNEEGKIKKFTNIRNDKDTLFIVALGVTGHGKSTLLNRLCGDECKIDPGDNGPFAAASDDQSVTMNPEHKVCTIEDNRCILVDTPGYDDTEQRDNLHLNNLEKYLYGSGGVDAFALVKNGTNPRFDGNFQNMLKGYVHYFGLEFWKYLVIILTYVEGHAKKTFDRDRQNKLDAMQNNLSALMPKGMRGKVRVPIITIGFDDGCGALRHAVMDAVIKITRANGKLNCKNIQSPIKKLKDSLGELQMQRKKLERKSKYCQMRINHQDAQIAPLQEKNDNPDLKDQMPILFNRKMQI